MGYISEPLQRRQLRNLALYINSLLGLQNELYFPVLPFFERVMPCLFEGFTYEIVPKDTFPEGKHADTDVVNHCIRIREDVYHAKALAGEIMCPAHLIGGFTAEEVAEKCGVSIPAAEYNLKTCRKGGDVY